MLDDLRQAAQRDADKPVKKQKEVKLFGMTALERMIVSAGIFMITILLSIMLLLAKGSVVL